MLMSSDTSRDFRMKRIPSINPSVGDRSVAVMTLSGSLIVNRLMSTSR